MTDESIFAAALALPDAARAGTSTARAPVIPLSAGRSKTCSGADGPGRAAQMAHRR